MLYRVNPKASEGPYLERQPACTLGEIGLLEADLQTWLKHHIDTIIRSDELMVIKESRPGEEMPDILALDATGRLFIFELKRWEADQSNLLQVMRYAQMSSTWRYEHLDRFYQADTQNQPSTADGAGSKALLDKHREQFGLDKPLDEHQWNHNQALVVVTNGLDEKTRKAVKYWRSKGLDIRPWVYRVYRLQNEVYLDINAFGQEDDPYEDRTVLYHLINTNYGNDPIAHDYMLEQHRAAAFYGKWKHKIDNIEKGDWVLLYQSGVGVVAAGQCQSEHAHITAPPHGPDDHGEEHYVELKPFYLLREPLTASQLRELAGYHIPLVSTYTSVRAEAGEQLVKACKDGATRNGS